MIHSGEALLNPAGLNLITKAMQNSSEAVADLSLTTQVICCGAGSAIGPSLLMHCCAFTSRVAASLVLRG